MLSEAKIKQMMNVINFAFCKLKFLVKILGIAARERQSRAHGLR